MLDNPLRRRTHPKHEARVGVRGRVTQGSGVVSVRLAGTYILRWETVAPRTKCNLTYLVQ